MESVLSRCIVSGNFIVTVLAKEVLWEMDKNTATGEASVSYESLYLPVLCAWLRVL